MRSAIATADRCLVYVLTQKFCLTCVQGLSARNEAKYADWLGHTVTS
jgi:hypothetical protein